MSTQVFCDFFENIGFCRGLLTPELFPDKRDAFGINKEGACNLPNVLFEVINIFEVVVQKPDKISKFRDGACPGDGLGRLGIVEYFAKVNEVGIISNKVGTD